jgi:hypothetical protein
MWILAKHFLLANWKWISVLAIIVGAFLFLKSHYYNEGRLAEQTKWEKAIKKEQERNDKLTGMIEASVDSYGKLAEKENKERVQKEIIRKNEINTIIQEKPVYIQCKVDQEVVDQQNQIKALGPKL